jgi:hypothetical protein
MSLPDPTLEDPPSPAALPHTQPQVERGLVADLCARVERLERAFNAHLTWHAHSLAPRLDRLEPGREACAVCNLPLDECAVLRAAPADAEPDASTVEHVMELVQEYAFVFGCHESAVAPKRDALRAAVEKLARGEDPR